ncbi:MAG: glycosyltransferase family 87 protein [Pseudomonadota bacterium]
MAEAQPQPQPQTPRWLIRVIGLVTVLFIAFALLVLTVTYFKLVQSEETLPTHYTDYYVFFGAAKLALSGDWTLAFDGVALHREHPLPQNQLDVRYTGWLYPPTYHVFLAPFGLVDLAPSWALFIAASVLALMFGFRHAARGMPGELSMVLLAPAAWMGVLITNNSLLSAACLVAALSALQRGRPVLAGILIGVMTLKPTVGLLIPVALAAGGHWRSFLWAAGTALVLALGATLITGVEYWSLLVERMAWASGPEGPGSVYHYYLVNLFGMLRWFGVEHGPALTAQYALTLGLMAMTWFVWRSAWAFELKAALLCLAIPLAAPHSFAYELIFTLGGIAFICLWPDQGQWRGARAWALRGVLVALFLLPLQVSAWNQANWMPIWLPEPVATTAAPLTLLTLALLLYLGRETSRPA